MRNWLISTEPKKNEYYDGILIHADTGLHEQAAALFQRYVPPPRSVLDIGAGPGAFSKRLADAGYAVTGMDLDAGQWAPRDIPFLQFDLNAGVSHSVQERFQAACCLEVIEHVENPWELLREIGSVLEPGGRLLLSTPNVTSFLSRLVFLRSGKFHQFDEADLAYGHINPVTGFELDVIARETGWRILEIQPGGYLPVFDFSERRANRVAFNLLRGLAYCVSKGNARGWCVLCMMEKNDLT